MIAGRKEIRKITDAEIATRIMLVADDEVQGRLLGKILSTDGYEVSLALDGARALSLYKSFKPDVIIIDVVMRDISGHEIARQLNDLHPDLFVPIIFITSTDSAESVMKCLEYGGVDCLIKPYNPAVLNLKIQTYTAISNLHKTSKFQRDKLEEHARYLESSYAIAEDVFHKVMHSDVLGSNAIKYSLSPIAIFNGDILLAAYRPSGELHVMLGDFTGHGLSAAIGAIPVSDIFYGMTEKGFSISEIIQEINSKLYMILPRGLFLASCLIEYENSTRKLSVINAGLPDALVYNDTGSIRFRLDARNYPLGVKPEISVIHNLNIYELDKDDRILMYTDGLVEAKNRTGEQYGLCRVEEAVQSCVGKWRVEVLQDELKRFVGDAAITDDVTMIELDLSALDEPILAKKIDVYPEPVSNAEWKMSYCFGPDTLRQVDPLPNIVQSLMELQKLHKFKQDIFVILKELFVNAIDHGLLGLDSSIKNAVNGFSKYMQERKRRLKALKQGIISIELVHTRHPEGGILDVYVYDSGKGFDVVKHQENMSRGNVSYHGMGLILLNKICASVEYNDVGNEVHARYIWRA